MTGPHVFDRATLDSLSVRFRHLAPGHLYRVTRPFVDHDGAFHREGETWTFMGSSFLPYDDGLSLYVSLDGRSIWQMRLQDRPTEQGPIIGEIEAFVSEVPSDRPPPF